MIRRFAQSSYVKIANTREIHVGTGHELLEQATGGRGIRFSIDGVIRLILDTT